MSTRAAENVLIVVLDEQPDLAAVRAALAGRPGRRVRLVAPAHVGPVHWYATDEDEERADAEARAALDGAAVARIPHVERVEAVAGKADSVLAVEDALSDFPADRILVVGEDDSALDRSLRRLAIPVEHLGETSPGGGLNETGRAIMSGRSGGTPFAVFGGAMVVMATVVALMMLLAALILWV